MIPKCLIMHACWGEYEKSQSKTESAFIIECCFCLHSHSKTAAIYSPTFTQYHRRGWA